MAQLGEDAGGQAVAGRGGGRGRAAAPGDARDRENQIHQFIYLQRNTNHDSPMTGKSKKKLTLAKKLRVANEAVNIANKALIDTYNDMWDVGDALAAVVLADADAKKRACKEERRALRKCFADLIAKVSVQKAAVVRLGGAPVPFPLLVQNLLPEVLQDMPNHLFEVVDNLINTCFSVHDMLKEQE